VCARGSARLRPARQGWGRAGEDTAFQPLVPDLIAALGSAERTTAIAEVGRRYVAAMRARAPAGGPAPARVVDKMLRNAWNVGHIAIALPQASVVRARAAGAGSGPGGALRRPVRSAAACALLRYPWRRGPAAAASGMAVRRCRDHARLPCAVRSRHVQGTGVLVMPSGCTLCFHLCLVLASGCCLFQRHACFGVRAPPAQVHVVRHPLDVALSCYAQPFEGRGTPWAWDLRGAPPAYEAAMQPRLPVPAHPCSHCWQALQEAAPRARLRGGHARACATGAASHARAVIGWCQGTSIACYPLDANFS